MRKMGEGGGRSRKKEEEGGTNGTKEEGWLSQPGPVGLVLNDACYGWLSQPVACKYGSG